MSLLKSYAESIGAQAARDYLASPEFEEQLRRHVRWAMQGYEPGFSMKDRERFTQTVADRIHEKARNPVYLFGLRIWRRKPDRKWCWQTADGIVEAFLDSEKIKFGDPRFYWGDGVELADNDMEYWESCP